MLVYQRVMVSCPKLRYLGRGFRLSPRRCCHKCPARSIAGALDRSICGSVSAAKKNAGRRTEDTENSVEKS